MVNAINGKYFLINIKIVKTIIHEGTCLNIASY